MAELKWWDETFKWSCHVSVILTTLVKLETCLIEQFHLQPCWFCTTESSLILSTSHLMPPKHDGLKGLLSSLLPDGFKVARKNTKHVGLVKRRSNGYISGSELMQMRGPSRAAAQQMGPLGQKHIQSFTNIQLIRKHIPPSSTNFQSFSTPTPRWSCMTPIEEDL